MSTKNYGKQTIPMEVDYKMEKGNGPGSHTISCTLAGRQKALLSSWPVWAHACAPADSPSSIYSSNESVFHLLRKVLWVSKESCEQLIRQAKYYLAIPSLSRDTAAPFISEVLFVSLGSKVTERAHLFLNPWTKTVCSHPLPVSVWPCKTDYWRHIDGTLHIMNSFFLKERCLLQSCSWRKKRRGNHSANILSLPRPLFSYCFGY